MAACLAIARKRNLNRILWVILGGFFGPIAILFALLIRNEQS